MIHPSGHLGQGSGQGYEDTFEVHESNYRKDSVKRWREANSNLILKEMSIGNAGEMAPGNVMRIR